MRTGDQHPCEYAMDLSTKEVVGYALSQSPNAQNEKSAKGAVIAHTFWAVSTMLTYELSFNPLRRLLLR